MVSGVKMKKLASFLIIFGIFINGCVDESSLVSAEFVEVNQASAISFLGLPTAKEASLFKSFSASKRINNYEGGEITISDEYTAANGNIVKVYSNIVFPSGAFYGSPDLSFDITMQLDAETTSEIFSPHIQFNNYPTYHVRYEGLDLSGADDRAIQFLYKSDDGEIEEVESDQVFVDVASGTLEVTNVKLPHFSRYGFAN
jgi:hypothetical protein